MAGPKAERVVAELAAEFPGACFHAREVVKERLAKTEDGELVIFDSQVEIARQYLKRDESAHKAVEAIG